LVVGGGEVAERKVLSLIQAGACVEVISPKVTERIRRLAKERIISWTDREYRPGDSKNAFLVISATDNPVTNASIAQEADRLNTLLNVVDSPQQCNFIVPASVFRGNLLISTSTSGKCPALAKRIRKEIQQNYRAEYGPLLEVLGLCRELVLDQVPDIEIRKQIFEQLAESISPEMIRDKDIPQIMENICQTLNDEDFPLHRLETGIRNILKSSA
jgi:precorrin-2 dehydrogenase/sirohydrochlorin ferrochelatase